MATAPSARADVLNSWKEIADYLRRGVRTVQRWEREQGLPVHRPQGTNHSAVLAFRDELDEWLRRTPTQRTDHRDAGSLRRETSRHLLAVARSLLAQGERLAELDERGQTHARRLVLMLRDAVRELSDLKPDEAELPKGPSGL